MNSSQWGETAVHAVLVLTSTMISNTMAKYTQILSTWNIQTLKVLFLICIIYLVATLLVTPGLNVQTHLFTVSESLSESFKFVSCPVLPF